MSEWEFIIYKYIEILTVSKFESLMACHVMHSVMLLLQLLNQAVSSRALRHSASSYLLSPSGSSPLTHSLSFQLLTVSASQPLSQPASQPARFIQLVSREGRGNVAGEGWGDDY